MLPLSGLVHQIISVDAVETVPTETTTAFRGLFEQTRGVAAQYNIRPPSGPRRTPHNRHPPARRFRSLMLVKTGLIPIAKHQKRTPPGTSRTNGFQGYCYAKRNNKPTSQREMLSVLVKKRPHPVTN
jgi:hypothetical protein